MALNVYELARSRPLTIGPDSVTLSLKFVAAYSTDVDAVYAAVLAAAPTTFDGYLRSGARCDPQGVGLWVCEVEYTLSPSSLDGTIPAAPTDSTSLGPNYQVEITAGQVHITQSLRTNRKWQAADQIAGGVNLTVDAANNLKVTPDGYAVAAGDVGKSLVIQDGNGWTGGVYTVAAQGGGQWTLGASPAAVSTSGGKWVLVASINAVGTADSFKQAIGVTTSGVAGADIYTPAVSFSVVTQADPFNLPQIRVLRDLTATVNNATWYGFDAGEVLYLGCSTQVGVANKWTLTHKFAIGKNVLACPVSDTLVVPLKPAWDYLWCTYQAATGAGQVLQVPKAAYVEQVYRYTDFSLLGIGV